MALESQSQVTGLTLILKYRITTPDAQGRGGLGIAEQEDSRASAVAERAGGPYQANPRAFSPKSRGQVAVWHTQEIERVAVPGPAGTSLTASVQGHQILFSLEMYILGRGLPSITPELPGSGFRLPSGLRVGQAPASPRAHAPLSAICAWLGMPPVTFRTGFWS